MAITERQQKILDLLKKFQGLDPFKELFWSELNYERVNQTLPRRKWPDTAAKAISEDPVLFANAGQGGDFHVIYCRLASEKLRAADERPVVSRLLQEHPYALFVFSNNAQNKWHFINVKYDANHEKRRLFRRITVSPEEQLRTATERFSLLDVSAISPDLFGLSPLAIQNKHDEAFDVEAVTRQFFDEYKELFKILQNDLLRQTKEKSWAHDYALQFLSRCMFLYFIQRKRWLGGDTEFVRSFWEAYKDSKQQKDSFFEKWLSVLFFEAFNKKFHGGHSHFPDKIKQALSTAPYLNGGLFTKNDLDKKHAFTLTDAQFEQVFTFLQRYNFTIAEDSPLDQEVAVDPEMIGKVYESLVNVTTEADERGDAGIFYTPRTEIDLMCRLALVDNVANHLGYEHKNLFYEVVFALEPDEKESADKALNAAKLWDAVDRHLRAITVLDPACGSGSFLVGMLHILDDLQSRAAACLSADTAHLGIKESAFERKKRIIGQSLYGVDVMDWAAHVAELRLWLALIIDAEFTRAELASRSEPLLPYFTFKIRVGNSLLQEIGGINFGHRRGSLSIDRTLKTRITQLKDEKLKFYRHDKTCKFHHPDQLKSEERKVFSDILFARAHKLQEDIKALYQKMQKPKEKQIRLDGSVEESAEQIELETAAYQKQADALKDELAVLEKARETLQKEKGAPFVWDIAFVEIFEGENDGFDIVIGNPPYVRTRNISDPKLPREKITAENKKEYKGKLSRSVYQAFTEFFGYKAAADAVSHKLDAKSDLYIYFYFHGLSLLNSQGSFCFITSNSWLDVGYGADLQEFLLKACHVKFVLDNQAKRSFASADVNTVISLFSAPDLPVRGTQTGEKKNRLSETARFVMFKVPFEHVLSAVVFEELEATEERKATPEYRIYPLKQDALLADGCEMPEEEETAQKTKGKHSGPLIKIARYTGNKWGGKYLRAPDILFTLLGKGQGILKPTKQFAAIDTYLILPKKSDQVLILPKNEIPGRLKNYFKPFVRSPRYFDKAWLSSSQHYILVCNAEDTKRNISLKQFIKDAAKSLKKEFNVEPKHDNWFVVEQIPAPLLWQRRFGERHLVFYNPCGFYSYDFYRIFPFSTEKKYPLMMAGSLMSTPFWLFKELYGRTNLGEGALKTEGTDLGIMCLFDPLLFPDDMTHVVEMMLKRDILSFSEEITQEDRKAVDGCIFDALSLTQGERDAVYEAVINLVEARLKKAQSM